MTVLIADDSKSSRDVVRFLITKQCNAVIKEASNGLEALDYIKSDNIDVLITDIKMPQMNGIDLIEQAKIINRDIQVIVFSAFGIFDFAKKALQFGAINYILKPISATEFNKTLSTVILSYEQKQSRMSLKQSEEITNSSDPQETDFDSNISPVIKAALDIIHNEYMYDIDRTTVANRIFISSAYLSHLFKKEIGKNFSQYLTEYRFSQACSLLSTSTQNIQSISKAVGFSNYPYFCSQFKKYYGQTCIQYRESHFKGDD